MEAIAREARRERLLTDPLRHPEAAEPVVRDRRAWLLIVSTLLVPGTAQIVAGNKNLGRWGLRVFIGFWCVLAITLLVFVLRRGWVFSLVTRSWFLALATAVLIALALFWAFLFVDALRLVRPVQLKGPMRAATAAVVALLMVITSGGLVYGATLVNAQRGLISSIFGGGTMAGAVDGRYNILLLGGDAGKGRIGNRPDSISLVSVDAKTGAAVIFGIPRNLQDVPFPASSPMHKKFPDGYNCGNVCLMNAIYQEGQKNKALYPGVDDPGAQAMKDAAEGITGLKVQYYAMIDLKGFQDLIDAMGGLTITSKVRVPISGPVIPGTDTHTKPKGWIEPGTQKMDGFHALWFARSREGATDYARMTRQRCVQKAMLGQLDPGTLLTRFQKIAGAAPEVVSTDIPEGQLGGFVDLALKSRSQEIGEAAFVPPLVKPAYPDYTVIRHAVTDALDKSEAKAAGDSPTKKATPKPTKKSSGSDKKATDKKPTASDSEDTPAESDICVVP